MGNFRYRALGKPLDANDTTHLFIGVDSLAEAELFFREWIAPDVNISEDHGNLICPLTDKDGNAQGTVYFRPVGGNGLIAEVSASDDTRLLYFRQITFMHNSVWPLNSSESKWHKFDIVHNLDIPIKEHLHDADKSLNWVCVRESGNGVPPVIFSVLCSKKPMVTTTSTMHSGLTKPICHGFSAFIQSFSTIATTLGASMVRVSNFFLKLTGWTTKTSTMAPPSRIVIENLHA